MTRSTLSRRTPSSDLPDTATLAGGAAAKAMVYGLGVTLVSSIVDGLTTGGGTNLMDYFKDNAASVTAAAVGIGMLAGLAVYEFKKKTDSFFRAGLKRRQQPASSLYRLDVAHTNKLKDVQNVAVKTAVLSSMLINGIMLYAGATDEKETGAQAPVRVETAAPVPAETQSAFRPSFL